MEPAAYRGGGHLALVITVGDRASPGAVSDRFLTVRPAGSREHHTDRLHRDPVPEPVDEEADDQRQKAVPEKRGTVLGPVILFPERNILLFQTRLFLP